MKRILIVGNQGQVSQYLQAALAGSYELIVTSREQLDLTNTSSINAFLTDVSPDIIINPAAYTAVDNAEKESELAHIINRDAVAEMAAYSANTNTPLIHFSTDYVFAGDSSHGYIETDETAPVSVYGKSKLAGEQAIINSGAPALVLRTAWVYSNKGGNFYKTMLSLAQNRNELSIVNDQFGAPTFAGSIADGVKQLLEKIVAQDGLLDGQKGVYHFTCQGQTNWCEFAQSLFTLNNVTAMSVTGIPSSEYPTPAKRPAYSVLNGNKLQDAFSVSLPTWQDALKDCAIETNRAK